MLRRLEAVTDEEILSAPSIAVLVLFEIVTTPRFIVPPADDDDRTRLTLVVESRKQIADARDRVQQWLRR